MKILVTTSDQYLHLIEPHAVLFNRYWPNQDVTILGFDDKNIPQLPDNFEYVSLGKQDDFGRYWTNPLIPYIDKVKDEYFVVMMGDFLLTDYVDFEKLEALEKEIRDGDADKVVLDTHLSAYTVEYKPGVRKVHQLAPYRTTLHPAIWKREYFKKYLNPNYTAWDFEIKNMPESQRDGALILLPEMPAGITSRDPAQVCQESVENNVIKATNVYVKGVPIPRPGQDLPFGAPNSITNEDILLIMRHVNPKLCEQLAATLKDGKRYK